MICPRCKSKTSISDTRITKSFWVRRMHECVSAKCHFRFPTRELPVEELERLWEIERRAKEFSALLSAGGSTP